jgi:ribosomal protein L11
VLNAGASAGVAGGLGPLLSRLGGALRSEGINVSGIVSIFNHETALALVPNTRTPTLVIVARTPDQSRTAAELASLEVPLAQLFKAPGTNFGSGKEALFNDRQVGAITAHELALANGLQLDYAVANGLVVISTSLQGISAVLQRSHPLGAAPDFHAVLASRPTAVTSLVYLDIAQLLALGEQTGLAGSARFRLVRGDLDKVQAVGLTSTRGPDESTSELTVRVTR